MSLSDTRVRFAFDAVELTSKLIDGTFPDYQRVIPVGNDKVLKVDRRSFAEAVDRVSTISSEKSRAVKLSLKAGALTLSATSPENGSASEEPEVSYRSDEHTSELQSLMRISYAVFCLKKKNKTFTNIESTK